MINTKQTRGKINKAEFYQKRREAGGLKQLGDIIWKRFCYDYGCFRLDSGGPKGFERNVSESLCVNRTVDPGRTQEKSGNGLEDRLVLSALIHTVQGCRFCHGTRPFGLLINQSK